MPCSESLGPGARLLGPERRRRPGGKARRGDPGGVERGKAFPGKQLLSCVLQTKAERADHGREGSSLGTGNWFAAVKPHDWEPQEVKELISVQEEAGNL